MQIICDQKDDREKHLKINDCVRVLIEIQRLKQIAFYAKNISSSASVHSPRYDA
jgi:hypothetical protein